MLIKYSAEADRLEAWVVKNSTWLGGVTSSSFLFLDGLFPGCHHASSIRPVWPAVFFVCFLRFAILTQQPSPSAPTSWAIRDRSFAPPRTHHPRSPRSLGLYVSLRLVSPGWLKGGVPRGVLIAIGASQLVLAALLGCLYFGHIRWSAVFSSIGSLEYLQRYFRRGPRESSPICAGESASLEPSSTRSVPAPWRFC